MDSPPKIFVWGPTVDIKMAAVYERFEDEPFEVESLQSSDSDNISNDQILVMGGPTEGVESDTAEDKELIYQTYRIRRMHRLLQNKWPFKASISQLVLGGLLIALGLIQIVILPLVNDQDASMTVAVKVNKDNCFGISEWVGLIFFITGCLGIKAAMNKSISLLYGYFVMLLVELAVLIAAFLLVLIGFVHHWTTLGGLEGDKVQFYIHLSVSLLLGGAFLVTIGTLLQYYEDVFFGELQCCKRCVHCFLPCLCPRPVQEHELLHGSEQRPPSLPV